jgi:hypothetical protein
MLVHDSSNKVGATVVTKKRKTIVGHSSQEAPPSSFTDTLKKLQDEAVAAGKSSTGEELWPRPECDLKALEDVTFQQIDIEEHTQQGHTPAIRI